MKKMIGSSGSAAARDAVVDNDNPLFRLANHGEAWQHRNLHAGRETHEGFYRNDEKQQQAAAELANVLGMSGRVLDVGCGSNIHVSEGFAGSGREAYAIDLEPVPQHREVQVFHGSASFLGRRGNGLPVFNAMVCWGSWFGYCGGESAFFRDVWGIPSLEDYVNGFAAHDRNAVGKDIAYTAEFAKVEGQLLERMLNQLTYGGQLVIISGRFSYENSPAPELEQLPEEKRRMQRLAGVLEGMGAEELMLVGVSGEGVRKLAAEHGEAYVQSHLRANPPAYPAQDTSRRAAEARKTLAGVVEQLCRGEMPARIDAIAARFYR